MYPAYQFGACSRSFSCACLKTGYSSRLRTGGKDLYDCIWTAYLLAALSITHVISLSHTYQYQYPCNNIKCQLSHKTVTKCVILAQVEARRGLVARICIMYPAYLRPPALSHDQSRTHCVSHFPHPPQHHSAPQHHCAPKHHCAPQQLEGEFSLVVAAR